MPPVDTARIPRRMDRDRIEQLLDDLMPHAQAVIVDWARLHPIVEGGYPDETMRRVIPTDLLGEPLRDQELAN